MNSKMTMIAMKFAVAGRAVDGAMSDKPLPFGRYDEAGAQVESGQSGALRVKLDSGKADVLSRLEPADGTGKL